MRYVLYVSRLRRNLLQLFVEKVFLNAGRLVCETPEGRIAYKTRFDGFMQFSLKLLVPEMKGWPKRGSHGGLPVAIDQLHATLGDQTLSEFARRRHEAVKAQMLYGGLR
ncbi:MAG TPA: hypothetical protein V6C89_21170 [Drouetiella sp.]|jgi:hypothetical protein